MTEYEFLLFLNSLTIAENYDEKYFKNLMIILSVFFKSDEITSNLFKRKNEKQIEINADNIDDCIVINVECINSKIIIKSPKRKLENKEVFIKFLESILNNIFRNKQICEKLKMEKDLDALLNVLNRNAYERLLSEPETHENVGIAYIDVNGLGVTNNMYGHEAGDKMLTTIVTCIKNVFRLKDIYRIGGDEFVIISKDIPSALFEEKLEKVLRLISLTEYSICYGSTYVSATTDLKPHIQEASTMMEKNKDRFHKEHPEKYQNKYEVSYVSKKN